MKTDTTIAWLEMGAIPINVGFTTSPKAFAKERASFGLDGNGVFVSEKGGASTHTFTDNDDSSNFQIIVTIEKKKRDVPTLVWHLTHEATHVWQGIKERLGETRPGDEMEAYTIGWLAKCFVEEYLK